jgi:hypothetical protein
VSYAQVKGSSPPELHRSHHCAKRWLRGKGGPQAHPDDDHAPATTVRVRSTRRLTDVPDLPRLPVDNRTLGRTFEGRDGQVFQLSLFLTLDSYGRVREDGTPVHLDGYDYRRASTSTPQACSPVRRTLTRACMRGCSVTTWTR